MSDERSFFPKKWTKVLPTGFAEDAESLDEAGLKRVIVESESNIYTIDKEKEADATLEQAKERVKDLSSAYGDAKKCQTAKIKYCLFLLESRGINLDFKEDTDE